MVALLANSNNPFEQLADTKLPLFWEVLPGKFRMKRRRKPGGGRAARPPSRIITIHVCTRVHGERIYLLIQATS